MLKQILIGQEKLSTLWIAPGAGQRGDQSPTFREPNRTVQPTLIRQGTQLSRQNDQRRTSEPTRKKS